MPIVPDARAPGRHFVHERTVAFVVAQKTPIWGPPPLEDSLGVWRGPGPQFAGWFLVALARSRAARVAWARRRRGMTGCLLIKPGGPPWLERRRHRLRFRWQAFAGRLALGVATASPPLRLARRP